MLVQIDVGGVAAVTFAAHVARIVTETLRAAVAYTEGAAVLDARAQELAAAQGSYDEAADIAVLAVAQENAAAPNPFEGVLTDTVSAGAGPLRAVAREQSRDAVARAVRAAPDRQGVG